MARLRLDAHRAKLHWSYSIAEAAALFGVCRNTVRAWIAAGLPTMPAAGLTLIAGEDLRRFIEGRQKAQRTKCPPGTMFCMGCRQPRAPKPGTAWARQTNE